MMSMFDYIKWRGDLSFDERELNEIDSLILSYLSYEMFDGLVEGKTLTIQEIAEKFFAIYDEKVLENRLTLSKKSYLLLKEMANAPRYQSLILTNYVNEIDHEHDLQFSACTFQYKDKWKYIAFRGTDDTFTGWKEDFSMSYKKEILSQRKAVEYLNKVSSDDSLLTKVLNKCDYYVGGHSKGGNLAMYASAFVPHEVQKRIKRIYNFDGPGFMEHVWLNSSIQSIKSKIHTYIPTSSLFGRMFVHQEKVTVIKSSQIGLIQHDPLYWHVSVDHFVYANDVSDGSDKAIVQFNEMLNEYDIEKREELIESIFGIFKRLNIYTFEDLLDIDVNRIFHALKELSDLNSEQRKIILEFLKIVVKVSDMRNANITF